MSDHIADAIARLCADGTTDRAEIYEAIRRAVHETPIADRLTEMVACLTAMIHSNNDLTGQRRLAADRRMVDNRRLAEEAKAKKGPPAL